MFDWITGIIAGGGYLGIVFAMFLENVFPPIPSELVMIFSGAAASDGSLNLWLVIVAGSVGSVLGLLPWYSAGRWYGRDRLKRFANRHGRLLTFSGKDVDAAHDWFERHGKGLVFLGRFVPGIRTFIAIPAAILRMNIWPFMFYAFLGSMVWDGIFAGIGYYVGGHGDAVTRYVDLATYIVLGVVIIWYAYRVVTFKPSE